MSRLYNVAKQIFNKVAQKASGQGITRGEAIKSVKPSTKITLEGEKKKAALRAKSDVQKSFGPVNEKLRNQLVDMRQTLQKIRKEPITKSGVSKGKDVTPGIYEQAGKKRKQLKFGGGADMGSKKLSPKQMKIASLAGNKKKIDAPDFKKLRAMKSPISKSVRKS